MGGYRGGRKRGTKNKKTNLFALCEEEQINVFREMLLEVKEMPRGAQGRFRKLAECAAYLYAKPKDMDITPEQVREHLEAIADDSERSA